MERRDITYYFQNLYPPDLLCFQLPFLWHTDMGLGFTGDSAWSPEVSSYNQHLTMELGDRYEIRSIATRGRAHTNEYVTEYIVQYSDDGQAWTSYESQDGVDEVPERLHLTVPRMPTEKKIFQTQCCVYKISGYVLTQSWNLKRTIYTCTSVNIICIVKKRQGLCKSTWYSCP